MGDKQRSPNYPGFGLNEAILKAKQLYERDGKSQVPRDVAVQAWGYQGLNGASLRALGALRQFGLLDTPTPGSVKISGDALVLILEPKGSTDYQAAMSSVAFRPAIFRTLQKQYPETLPSDAAIISFLVRTANFSEDAARVAIASYKDTLTIASNAIRDDTTHDDAEDSGHSLVAPQTPIRERPNREKDMPAMETTGAQPYDLTLALMGGVQATLRIPRHMSEENYTLLTTLIDANLKVMRPALIAQPPSEQQET